MSKIRKIVKSFLIPFKIIRYQKLNKRHISIISNNCIGGFLYNRYACRFLTPTINLQIPPKDYVKFCSNMSKYLKSEIIEDKSPDNDGFKRLGGIQINFPVGKLDDITIYFQYYETFEYAKQKWNTRKERINYENMYLILVDTNCEESTINDFLKLPFENKLFITSNENYKDTKNCCFINAGDNWWFDINKKTGKPYYYKFDFYNWFVQSKSSSV